MKMKCHWFLRTISLVLVSVQGLCTMPVSVWAGTPPETVQAGTNSPLQQVNRRQALDETPSYLPLFSPQPATSEFFAVRIFPFALVPVGNPTPAENMALALALLSYVQRSDPEDQSILLNYLTQYPNSAWKPALLLNLGIFWRETGYFSKAMDAWQQAWDISKNATSMKDRALADRAVGELAQISAWVGRYEQLEPLLTEIGDRKLVGGAAEMVSSAQDGLWIMNHKPDGGFLCGPCALELIVSATQGKADLTKLIAAKSSRQGFSLAQLKQLADESGMKYQMAKRAPGSVIVTNSVIHWKLNHYGALLEEENGRYLVRDSTFSHLYGQELWVSGAALEEESDGYFLVPEGPLPPGWESVNLNEGQTVWGKGATYGRDPNALTPNDPCIPCEVLNWLESIFGMTKYTANLMLVSLKLEDMPLRYNPPVGPPVEFKVTYNQRDPYSQAFPNYSNLGAQWSCDWFTYIEDEGQVWSDYYAHRPSIPGIGSNVQRFVSGGGLMNYTLTNASTGLFMPDRDGNILQFNLTNNTYELTSPDGSKEIFKTDSLNACTDCAIPEYICFTCPPPPPQPRRFYLHAVIDPAGNALIFSYDSMGRLYQVNDAVGQATTLYYGLPEDPYKVTSVMDPFGRTSYLQYDENGRLQKIEDVIGMSSSFNYNSADFVTQLTTPYGVTTFSMMDGGGVTGDRALYITDPNGDHEYVYSPATTSSDPFNVGGGESAPSGFTTSHLTEQNTFYFDKKAMSLFGSQLLSSPPSATFNGSAFASGVMTNALIYHWLKDDEISPITPIMSGILGSIKPPLESRIWFEYPDQVQTEYSSGITLRQPNIVERFVDNPVNPSSPLIQTKQYAYNNNGRIAQFTDPVGRQTAFDYYTNGIDLYRVRQATNDILAEFGTYNSQHRPSTYIDAARMTNYLSWNAAGQLFQVTDPRSEIIQLNYDSYDYLRSVVRSKSSLSATNSFGYDFYGRLDTVTNAENYNVACSYDALDRPTNITYADGTSEKYVYNRLDLFLAYDREGSRTVYQYDNTGRPISIKDRLNQVTYFGWCGCGSLASVADPLGHVTAWDRDLEGRATQKTYDNYSTVKYAYETYGGRLQSITDSANQVKTYTYNVDDTISNLTYSSSIVSTPNVKFYYDSNYRRLTSMVDGTGTSTFTYNPVTGSVALGAGQLESEYQPEASATINYLYDELGRMTNRAVDGSTDKVSFDALGRLASHSTALGVFTPSYVNNTYQLASLTYPNSQSANFSWFNNAGDQNLQEIWHKDSSSATISKFDYQFDVNSRIKQWMQQAGAGGTNVLNLAYDYEDQLTDALISSNNAPVKAYAYGYDGAGNRTNAQFEIRSVISTNVIASYALYNDLNQLTNRVGNPGPLPVHFRGTVDEPASVTVNSQMANVMPDSDNLPNGKIFAKTLDLLLGTNAVQIVATDYGALPKVTTKNYSVSVTGDTNKIYAYDANGNCTNVVSSGTNTTYTWDAENRLVAIDITNAGGPDLRSEFNYDGFDRRVQIVEKNNGTTTGTKRFVWSGGQLCEERDASDTVTKRFYSEGEQISGTSYFYTFDHLGSVREMTDSSGTIHARYDYDPYGKRSANEITSSPVEADFGFTGYYVHQPSGLQLALYRAYDADSGRFINRDPIEEEGGLNLYDYVANNPANYVDPLGLWTVDLRLGLGVLGGNLKFGTTEKGRFGFGLGWAPGVHLQGTLDPSGHINKGVDLNATVGESEGLFDIERLGWEGELGIHFGQCSESGAPSEAGIHGSIEGEFEVIKAIDVGGEAAGSLGTKGLHGDISPVFDIGLGFSWGGTLGFTLGF